LLESFIYTLNSVAPIFLLVLFGMFLKKIKFLNDNYCSIADKIVFNFALPFESVRSISGTDLSDIFSKENISAMLFFLVGIIAVFVVLCIAVPHFLKENSQRSVLIQGAVRGNYAIFALPLAGNMFGEPGRVAAAALLPIVIVMYNVLAVIAFSIFAPREGDKQSKKELFIQIVKTTAKNPLVLGIVVALVLSMIKTASGIGIPVFIMGAVEDVAALAVPLSLISIGVNFNAGGLKKGFGVSAWCVIFKNIIIPSVLIIIGILVGFRGISLAIVLISFGGPTAVSSYIMAKNMHGDHELASQVLLLSTVCSLFTVFSFVFLLKYLALI